MFLPKQQSVILRYNWTVQGLKDIVFALTDKADVRRVEYLPGKFLDQSFSAIAVHNLSVSEQLVYCTLSDGYRTGVADVITVSQVGGHGMKTVPAGLFVFEDVAVIQRLRLHLSGIGVVEVALYS